MTPIEREAARLIKTMSHRDLNDLAIRLGYESRTRYAERGVLARRPALQPATVALEHVPAWLLLLLCTFGLMVVLVVVMVVTGRTGL